MSSVTEEIKSRLDLVHYISQYVPLKKSGRTYKANCPFHAESTPSFHVDPDRQTWRCFGACAEGGDLFSFAQKYHGWDFKEALEQLGKQAGVEIRKQTPEQIQRTERLDRLRGLMQNAADHFHAALIEPKSDPATSALTYAQDKRGFSVDTIEKFGIGFAAPGWNTLLESLVPLGYTPEELIEIGLAVKNDKGRVYDRFRHRLMIPIRDERGRVVGFGARALNPEDTPKYLNSPQTPLFDKSRLLFGLDTAKRAIRDMATAVIVEGYMDAIQAQQAGFYHVVAQMGTAMTETQLGLIAPRYAKKVILALDSDAAGQSATRRSLEVAREALVADYAGRMSVDMRVLQIPDAKDPDDLIREHPEQWQALMDEALPVADFVIQMETSGLDRNASLMQREEIARQVLPILVASESNLYRQENIQKLALRLHIAETELMRWAQEERQQQAARPAPPVLPSAVLPVSAEVAPPDALVMDDFYDDDAYYQAIADYEAMARGMPPSSDAPNDDPPQIILNRVSAPNDDLAPIKPIRPAAPAAQTGGGTFRAEPDNAHEAYCLRMLFLHPLTYYQVNRRLREMADGQQQLLEGPFLEFGVGDFTRFIHRTLMQMFLFGLRQADADLLDFLKKELDASMWADVERLLQADEVIVTQQVKGRFDADLAHLLQQQERRAIPGTKPEAEIVLKALELRRARLKRELDEARFQQIEAQQKQDAEAAMRLSTQVTVLLRAMHRLDDGLELQRRQFA